ncbi:MAG: hypothetical protein Q7K20_01635 [Polaromonas sp.]|nr:hypothetical protein [Polaromonas sp.]
MNAIKIFSSFALALLLAGCASFSALAPGASREEVVARYGTPSRVLPLSAGTRLQYSRQPAGQTAVMVDLDAAGRVVAVRQVLTAQEFSKIEVGRWTRGDVERAFGPPAFVDRVASWPGDIMNYRWLDNFQNMLYWVYLDERNVVQRTGQGIEFPWEMPER